jgi:hypothetical protein
MTANKFETFDYYVIFCNSSLTVPEAVMYSIVFIHLASLIRVLSCSKYSTPHRWT